MSSMSIYPCARCAAPILSTAQTCPHCHAPAEEQEDVRPLPMLLMGLLLSACGDKDDTGDTGDTGLVSQPEYGVAETQYDDDEEDDS